MDHMFVWSDLFEKEGNGMGQVKREMIGYSIKQYLQGLKG